MNLKDTSLFLKTARKERERTVGQGIERERGSTEVSNLQATCLSQCGHGGRPDLTDACRGQARRGRQEEEERKATGTARDGLSHDDTEVLRRGVMSHIGNKKKNRSWQCPRP